MEPDARLKPIKDFRIYKRNLPHFELDRIIRDDEEYLEKMNYIVNNPLASGLVEKPENYRWLFFEGSG